jgi:MFS-type transporter involved in bile tolerance (Atg22 family)
MKKLKERWGITTIYQLLLIIVVFAINGSLSARISSYLINRIGINNDNTHWLIYYLILILLVLPIYPFLLMGFGYLFGQSKFFFPFGKRMLSKIGLGFIYNKKAS